MDLPNLKSDCKNERPWNFDAGNLALDFANTVDWHASTHRVELINTYTDLVNWARDFSVLTPNEAQYLTTEAKRQPEAARETLKNAITLRDSIYAIFSAITHKNQPAGKDLNKLTKTWGQAVTVGEIISREKGFGWNWDRVPPVFEQVLWPVANAAVDLLLSTTLHQVGQCADDRGCGLLFIDTSRNHSRQWCSMDSCGNRAKAQRHYQRSKTNK